MGLQMTPLVGEQKEELHVDRKRGSINVCLRVCHYIDKDTKQWISYIPSLEMSGYGSNKEEAIQMMDSSLEEYFDYLLSLKEEGITKELGKYGWKHSRIKKKDYSRAYIDVSGNLKDFAVEASLEEEMLQMA